LKRNYVWEYANKNKMVDCNWPSYGFFRGLV
jgi:hypothetical protein